MLTEKFLEYIKYERGYSSHTFLSYQADLELFETYIQNQNKKGGFDPKSVSTRDIRAWLVSMMDQGASATTISRRLSTLKSFYKFLRTNGYVDKMPTDGVRAPKHPQRLPVFVKEGEMEDLMELLDVRAVDDDFVSHRDRMVIEMFYALGVRVSELINIKEKDIDIERNVILITGKRNKQRLIPFGISIKSDILAFRKVKETALETDTDYLFTTATGEQMTRFTVYKLVKKYLSMVCSLKKLSPHVLRHTFATLMLNNGADINSVKELLGHANLQATEVYTHTDFDRLQKIYKQAHPRA